MYAGKIKIKDAVKIITNYGSSELKRSLGLNPGTAHQGTGGKAEGNDIPCIGCGKIRTVGCRIENSPLKQNPMLRLGDQLKHWPGPKVIIEPEGNICLDCGLLWIEAGEPTTKLPLPKPLPSFGKRFELIVKVSAVLVMLYLLWLMMSPMFY